MSNYCPNCERLQEQLHREHEEQDKLAARLCAEETEACDHIWVYSGESVDFEVWGCTTCATTQKRAKFFPTPPQKPDPNTYDRQIRVFHDGELWRAQSSSQPEGMEGFGPTIAEALRKLADEWEQYGFELAPREESHG